MHLADPCVLLCAVAVAAACAPRDLALHVPKPPRVIAIAPSSSTIALQPSFSIEFSSAMNPKTIDTDPNSKTCSVALMRANDVDDAFFKDFAHPPLAKKRAALAVPLNEALDGNALTIATEIALDASTDYVLVVSDRIRSVDGVALADNFVHHATTEPAAPSLASSDPIANARVFPNRKRFTATFTKPVRDVDVDSMHLEPAAETQSIEVSADRTSATLVLADPIDGCDRLAPSAHYAIVLEDAIVDDIGKHIARTAIPFDTVDACDTTPNVITALAHDDGDTFAMIHFVTTKPSTTLALYRTPNATVDRVVVGPSTSSANQEHDVRVDGLDIDHDYTFIVRAEDAVGSIATEGGTIHTASLPNIAVNEVFADPTTSPEDVAEFVELASFADSAIDLSSWSLRIHHGTETAECVVPSSTSLAANEFLVLASDAFDATAFGLDEASIARVASWCHLANGVAITVELVDDTGRIVNTLHVPKSIAGRSFEKTKPDADDIATSVCASREDVGPTPGRENGVAIFGCEESP